MFVGLLRSAATRAAAAIDDGTDEDDRPVVPYPNPRTIDQALGNLEAFESPEDMDPEVRRALIRERQHRAASRQRGRHV